MSALTCILNLDDRRVARRDLEAMQRALAHRGPDHKGMWLDGAIALGYLGLDTVPAAAAAPMPFEYTSALVLTGDLRLDNRDELAAACYPTGRPGTAADAELVLAAYALWGDDCVDRLLGDFAFALWDGRRRRLFCARDPLGVKPFYYAHRAPAAFACASEIKALVALPWISRRLNEARLADFLVDFEDDPVSTFYDGILRLPPAHSLAVTRRGLIVRPYWTPDAETELRPATDEDYAARFREHFAAAVRRRLPSDRPVAISLSGGLDSCSIACVARRLQAAAGNGDLRTYSMLYDSCPGGDERSFIEAMIRQGGLAPRFVQNDRVALFDHLEDLFYYFEEPLNNPFYAFGWQFWGAIHGDEVRAVLDGVDGDITVSYNFHYLSELARRGRLVDFTREAVGISRHYFHEQVSPFSIAWQRGLRPLLPRFDRWLRPLRSTVDGAQLDGRILRREFGLRTDLDQRLAARERVLRSLSTARHHHCDDLTSGMVAYALEGTNKLTAAFEIEPRHPYFDRQLVEFCVALPWQQRMRNGVNRGVVRRALTDLLPEQISRRTDKFDPSEYLVRRLLATEETQLRAVAENGLEVMAPYVDVEAARKIYGRFFARPTVEDAYAVWRLTVLSLWLRAWESGELWRPRASRERRPRPASPSSATSYRPPEGGRSNARERLVTST